ncbi:WD40 repeat-like protein [Schizopora paradoxa]|uniref:WD40 repeat-like protein n=1 Tax=Schizopora paradoxa TaxID=27342 RepID=A0A0H2RNS5_9AGAM|nr:WD40 repeat-like protein [Schizopora paradoxa]
MPDVPLTHNATLSLPAHATTVVFSSVTSDLAVGSDDGSVRIYSSPYTKVKKAVRNLGETVSGLVFAGQSDSECLWIAAGRTLLQFRVDSESKLILEKSDAMSSRTLGEDEEDALNDVAINSAQTHVAMTSDSGEVYVLDVSSGDVKEMRTKHSNIAWKAAFIPKRINELVSGGYDCTLIHFDYRLGTLLSSFEIPPTPALAPGISTLPPFITAMAISPSGVVATGTADGRIWVGAGGSKSSTPSEKSSKSSKKARKWTGLDGNEGSMTKSFETMISDLLFLSPNQLLCCSVSGKLALYKLVPAIAIEPDLKPGQAGSKRQILQEIWATKCDAFEKVDKMAVICVQDGGAKQVAICGLGKDGKGLVQLWGECREWE